MAPLEQDPGKKDHQRPVGHGEEDPEEGGTDGEGGDENEEENEIPPDPIHEATMARLREEHESLLRQFEQEGEILRQAIALRSQAEERHRELILQREQRIQQNQDPSNRKENDPDGGKDVTESKN